MFVIYINHLGGNVVQKHQSIKFDAVGELIAIKYTQME